MKNYTQNLHKFKLIAKFDNQLMNTLREDLKVFNANNPKIRKVSQQQQLLAA